MKFINPPLVALLILLVAMFILAPYGEYQLTTTWGSWGSGDGQFKSQKGVAVDNYGNVYVADYANHRIQPELPLFIGTGSQ